MSLKDINHISSKPGFDTKSRLSVVFVITVWGIIPYLKIGSKDAS